MAENAGDIKKRGKGQGTVTLTLSPYEQYILHLKTWTGDYHLSFAEIEEMPLEILLDLELVDSKVQAAFEEKQRPLSRLNKLYNGEYVFIDQIL